MILPNLPKYCPMGRIVASIQCVTDVSQSAQWAECGMRVKLLKSQEKILPNCPTPKGGVHRYATPPKGPSPRRKMCAEGGAG